MLASLESKSRRIGQLVALSCAWPMVDDGERVGEAIVEEWDRIMQQRSRPFDGLTFRICLH